MRFYVRFAYYLGGFSLGIFFLLLILNGKDSGCSYFPNARVLKDLRSKPFYYSAEAKTALQTNLCDTADIKKTLTYGKVDFSRSNKKELGGKQYFVAGRNKQNQNIELKVINYSDKVLLAQIKITPKN
ncbi:MAG: hypothetical protein RLZZ312_583 [Bacteroidota bacterium]|jgi:hypothetical protein